MTYSGEAGNSFWSDYKILATKMEPSFLKNEYTELFARGTGARNHDTSTIKIDNFVLLDHGAFRGLYLIVLSRKNLEKVYSGVYDLMLREAPYQVNDIRESSEKVCVNITATPETPPTGGGTTPPATPPSPAVNPCPVANPCIEYYPGGFKNLTIIISKDGNETCNYTSYKNFTKSFQNYSIDAQGNLVNQTYNYSQYNNPNEFEAAHRLAKKIKEYDSNYFIILVSQNSWEMTFSKELGEVLMACGAFSIMEFINHYSPRFGLKTAVRNIHDTDPFIHTNLYHPFAFIGIPGLAPGKGYEALRSNVGFHLFKANYPNAELRVRLKYQPLYAAYTFDTYQYMPENRFRDKFDFINKAKDYSLQSTYPWLVNRNMSSYHHWKTAIFLVDNRLGKQPIFFTNATEGKGNYTKADQMYFQYEEQPLKYDQIGRLYMRKGLVWAHDKKYYKFVQDFLFSDEDIRDCPPPYNNYTNPYCYNLQLFDQTGSHLNTIQERMALINNNATLATLTFPPEVLKCYTGIIPYYCPTKSQTTEREFWGFLRLDDNPQPGIPKPAFETNPSSPPYTTPGTILVT